MARRFSPQTASGNHRHAPRHLGHVLLAKESEPLVRQSTQTAAPVPPRHVISHPCHSRAGISAVGVGLMMLHRRLAQSAQRGRYRRGAGLRVALPAVSFCRRRRLRAHLLLRCHPAELRPQRSLLRRRLSQRQPPLQRHLWLQVAGRGNLQRCRQHDEHDPPRNQPEIRADLQQHPQRHLRRHSGHERLRQSHHELDLSHDFASAWRTRQRRTLPDGDHENGKGSAMPDF